MRTVLKISALALAGSVAASAASAGGLERSTFSAALIYEKGNYIEGSAAYIMPSVESDNGMFDINPSYSQFNLGAKFDINDRISVAFQTYEPSGTNISYASPVGLVVDISTRAYTLVGKVDIGSGFSAFAGAGYYTAEANTVNLLATTVAPGAIDHGDDSAFGWIGGVAYEREDIALRVSLTYESGAEFNMDTTGFTGLPFNSTRAAIPEALTLNFQSGVAEDTLLFGSVRYAKHADANIIMSGPSPVPATPISDLENTTTYTLGLARKLTDKWTASVSGTYEDSNGEPSTFAPTGDTYRLAIGARFQATEQLTISGGVSHTWLGDGQTATTPPFTFSNNNAWAFATKMGYRF